MKTKSPQPNTDKLEKLRRIKNDEAYYMENFLKIIDKRKQLVPLKLNKTQWKIKKLLDEQEARLGYIRAIIVKARQKGVSTYVQGRIFHSASMNRYIKALTVSHELDSSEHIHNMSKVFLQELPEEMIPMTRRTNRREILFENPNYSPQKKNHPGLRSHIRIDTADDVNVGASQTFSHLHLSEVARWRAARATLISLLQAVPDLPGTVIIFESTAQGVGDEFHRRYKDAESGLSNYIAIFIPWFEDDEYQMDLLPGEKLDYSEEELKLKIKFKLTDAQLKWRRVTIRDKCNGDPNLFRQEYPSTAKEAFITSGSGRYPHEDIERAATHVVSPEFVGFLERDSMNGRPKFVSKYNGPLQIWSMPVPGKQYIVSADISEGVEGGDYSVAMVFDHFTWEQVAMYRARTSPEDMGYVCSDLGFFYNTAIVAPEANSVGLATCVVLKNDLYPNIYYSRKKDEKTNERTKKIGFVTTPRTRQIGIGLLGKVLKLDDIIIRDHQTISELETFIVKDTGKVEAEEGCLDDCVLAAVIFVMVATELPPADFEKEKKSQPKISQYRGGAYAR